MNIPERPLTPPEPPEPIQITRCSCCAEPIMSVDELCKLPINGNTIELCERCVRIGFINGENYINDELQPEIDDLND